MDILSIRKKKAAANATTPPEPTSSTSPTLPPHTAGATLPPQVASSTLPPQSAASTMPPQPAASTQPPRAAASTLPTSAPGSGPGTLLPQAAERRQAVDPLHEFLACYDDDDDGHDFGASAVQGQESTERFLALEVDGESYAASIMDVREILKVRGLTDVPRAPRPVLGVLSKRGVVLPVVDLGVLLGLREPDRRLSARQRVLVVGEGDRVCGLRVDAVFEVIKLGPDQIEAVPASLGARNAGLLVGLGRVDDRMYIVLDLPAVLDSFGATLGLAPARRESET